MLEKEMFNIAKRDFEDIGIKLSDWSNVLIPGFYPDAIAEVDGRNVVVEFKTSRTSNIRNLILGVVNNYRKQVDFIGENGILILALAKDDSNSLDYYDLTNLVFSNERKIKSDLDNLLSSDKKLHAYMFELDSIDKGSDKQIKKFKGISREKAKQSKDARPIFVVILVIVILTIGVLDALGIYVLNYQRLILIGIFSVVMSLPIIKKLSFKDYAIEFVEAKDK